VVASVFASGVDVTGIVGAAVAAADIIPLCVCDAYVLLNVSQNEKSGSLMPDSGLPRRLRDPRAMRNDYGRLPYHLAMRKGFNWLAELLDPSVPVR
jgi:hypothetical protein